MDPNPNRSGHRRHHSETLFRLPSFTDDLLEFSDLDFSDDIPVGNNNYDNKITGSSNHHQQTPIPTHGRSLSVDAAFFDELNEHNSDSKHLRSGQTSPSNSISSDYTKKAMEADKLAELALLDPKRAKRILANRQSAARSKERKIKYTSELEKKVQTLQIEATTLSTQVTLLQRDTNGLTSENRELKLRLQAMEQQAHLRDALNDALREEVQRLKRVTGEMPNMNVNAYGRQLFLSNPQNGQQSYSQSASDAQSQSSRSQTDSMDYI